MDKLLYVINGTYVTDEYKIAHEYAMHGAKVEKVFKPISDHVCDEEHRKRVLERLGMAVR